MCLVHPEFINGLDSREIKTNLIVHNSSRRVFIGLHMRERQLEYRLHAGLVSDWRGRERERGNSQASKRGKDAASDRVARCASPSPEGQEGFFLFFKISTATLPNDYQ